MRRASALALAVVLVLTPACDPLLRSAAPAPRPEVPAGSGLVLLYAETAVTDGVSWSSATLAGLDGASVPLRLEPPRLDVTGPEPRRLLASGPVPAGRYATLVLARDAPGREPEAIEVAVPFAVSDRSGVVIALSAGSGASLEARTVTPSATGATGFAVCPAGGIVTMFDKRSGRVFGVVPTGRGPSSIAVDLERRRAYVALSGDDAIEVIDIDQRAIIERRPLHVGDEPVDLALVPGTRTLLVAARGSAAVILIDTQSLAELDRIEVPYGPTSLAVDRAGLRAFVACRGANRIAAIDLVSRRVSLTAETDLRPMRLQLDPAQTTLWVLHEDSPYIDGLDVRSLGSTLRLNLGAGGTAFDIDPTSRRLLVARRDETGIDVYDALSRLPVATLPAKGRVTFLEVDPETNTVLAAFPDASAIAAIGLAGRTASWSVQVGDAPAYLAVAGAR